MFSLKKMLSTTLFFGAAFLFVFSAHAAGPVTTAPKDESPHTHFVSASVVTITEPVLGDLLVVGSIVRIEAPVTGDLLVAAQTLIVDATVSGSIRGTTWSASLNAPVGQHVTLWTSALTMGDHATIGGDLWFHARTAHLAGVIAGNLAYSASVPAVMAKGTVIRGATSFTEMKQSPWGGAQSFSVFLFYKLVALFGLFVVGLVLVILIRRPSAMVMSTMLNEPRQSMLWGIGGVVAIPFLALLLSATIIGIPLGVIVAVLWAVSLYVAYVFVAITIGFFLLMRLDRHEHIRSMVWTLVIGGIAWMLLTSLPILGGPLKLMGIFWAFGALLRVGHIILTDFNMPPTQEKKE